MEATCSSEKLVGIQRNARRYMPENRTLHNHRCDNRKYYKKDPISHTNVVIFFCSKYVSGNNVQNNRATYTTEHIYFMWCASYNKSSVN
jgi:hypothetical protein